MTQLTESWFEQNPLFHRSKNYNLSSYYGDDFRSFTSNDRRIVATNIANLSNTAWNIHLDDSTMCSLADFDVETVEDANTILAIYGIKI